MRIHTIQRTYGTNDPTLISPTPFCSSTPAPFWSHSSLFRPLRYRPLMVRMRFSAFSHTAGFRHDSIPAAVSAIRGLGDAHGFAVHATEDRSVFNDEALAHYRAVVFLLRRETYSTQTKSRVSALYSAARRRVCRHSRCGRHRAMSGPGTASWSAHTLIATRTYSRPRFA